MTYLSWSRTWAAVSLILLALCCPAGSVASPVAGLRLYVSSSGSDAWPGMHSKADAARGDGPLATLEAARDRIRALHARPAKAGITVWMEGGSYRLETPFTLDRQDSGSADCPIVYRAMPGERVLITSGRSVSGWKAVADPAVLQRLNAGAAPHILVADLAARGIADYGQLSRRGFGEPVIPAGLELFFGNQPMPPAQWPQSGWARVSGVAADAKGTDLTYTGDEPGHWSGRGDIWLYGYWAFEWADDHVPVASINPGAHTLHIDPPAIPLGATAGARFRAINVLEELNRPGEWYLDRTAGKLYFWPPAKITPGSAVVSLGTSLVQMSGVSNISIQGVTLEDCRGTAVTLSNCTRCRIAGCVLRNIGNIAVDIEGGTGSGVVGCDISETGDGGVNLSGGDRQTLTPGRNFVDDCEIAHFSRWDRTYTPAVQVSGVGNRVTHCFIHDAPHSAIIISGNDHLIADNDITRVCRDTGDAGAFYIGRDWSMRGNVVRENYFHQLGGPTVGLRGFTNVNAIYLDDCASGTAVIGNICQDVHTGLQLGGGRDNSVRGNVFINCDSAFMVDARGLGWAKEMAAPGGDWHMQEKLADIHYDQPPYSVRYPGLANILGDNPGAPKGNAIFGNVISGGGPSSLNMEAAAEPFVVVKDNLTDVVAKVTASGELRLQPVTAGLPHIAVKRIGLYASGYRAGLP